MGMTIDYGKLQANSPKALGMRARKPRPIDPSPKTFIPYVTASCKSKLQIPDGTMRFYLRVPWGKERTAIAAGCRYDESISRWYIDNPSHPEDFANWKPSLVTGKPSPA